jgi:DNA end-binding protein Ku
MSARAIWKGYLVLGKRQVPVKMYSAIEDRAVHFHLLGAKDQEPVEQKIVRKDDGTEVPREQQRKAFPLEGDRAVILQPDELQAIQPEADREIHLLRFIPRSLLGDQWFDRPYVLGPDDDNDAYFALAEALDKDTLGIGRWVMRGKRYLGALSAADGYLLMTTMRRMEQVLAVPAVKPDKARTPSEAELKLAEQLVTTISGDFEPLVWKNDHRDRLMQLIEAKARGNKIRTVKAKAKPRVTDLAESLRASLGAAQEKKVA